MGVDCYGWVEVHDPSSREVVRFPQWWSGVIRINDIVDRNYRVYGYFFDIRNPFDTSLAGRRGAPPMMSQEALVDAGDPTDLAGASWVLWSEIEASDWRTRPELEALGWGLLFMLMANLAEFYGGDRVRLVIWFDHDQSVFMR